MRSFENVLVVAFRRISTAPCDIVTLADQRLDDSTRQILIREKAHLASDANRVDALGAQPSARVAQARPYVVAAERWVLVEDGVLAPPVSEPLDHELHRDSGTPHDRLAFKDSRVEFDTLFPVDEVASSRLPAASAKRARHLLAVRVEDGVPGGEAEATVEVDRLADEHRGLVGADPGDRGRHVVG